MSDTWLHVTCAFTFNVAVATPMVFMLRPRSSPGQWVASEEYRLAPSVQVVEFTDSFGNLCQRLVAPIGDFRINTSADVMVKKQPPPPAVAPFIEVPRLPDQVLGYLLPSRYCESDRFGQMATEIVAGCLPGSAQVIAIMQWVRKTISYTPGSSTFPVSAIEVHERGVDTLAELRGQMEEACPVLADIDEIAVAGWQPFGPAGDTVGDMGTEPFHSPVENFYMTDPISRCSETMAKCTEMARALKSDAA